MSTLENPAEWLIQALGAQKSTSGQPVNYRTALTIAYVWEACNIIAGDVASLPFEVKRVESDGDRVNDVSHRAYRLLNGMANEWLHSFTLRETMTHYALLHGNAMALIMRDSMGGAMSLYPTLPGDLKPELSDGRLTYVWQSTEVYEQGTQFDGSDVLHLRGLGDVLGGHSVIALARNSFGLALATDKHGAEHFKNGAQPRIILKHPGRLEKTQADELLERFEKRHAENGRPALASGGLEIETLPASNQSAQWNEARKQVIVEVAAWFGLPPHKLGDDTRIGYNGVQAENQAYITQCLRRWLRRWEVEVWGKLLSRREREAWAYECRHDPRQLLDTDTKQVTDEVTSQVGAMLITVNEGRRRLGYERVPDGDVRINPNTTSTPDVAPEPPTANAAGDRAAFVSLLSERLTLLQTTLEGHANRIAKKGDDWSDWSVTCGEKFSTYIEPTLTATASVFTGCMDAESVRAVVSDWAELIRTGGDIYPTPAALAEQILGATT